MSRISVRTFATRLAYYSVDADRLSTLTCRDCRALLDIHQPSSERPDQFLGTCAGCGHWFRIEAGPGADRVTVLHLPEVTEVNATALAAD